MRYLRAAFDKVLDDAEQPERWYVCLLSAHQAYGGPEEGGWWYTVNCVEAFREFPCRELADAAAKQVEALATEMSRVARKEHGDHCLQTMEWLDARGLEADFLPEPDGALEYRVEVLRELPVFNNSRPQYS